MMLSANEKNYKHKWRQRNNQREERFSWKNGTSNGELCLKHLLFLNDRALGVGDASVFSCNFGHEVKEYLDIEYEVLLFISFFVQSSVFTDILQTLEIQ